MAFMHWNVSVSVLPHFNWRVHFYLLHLLHQKKLFERKCVLLSKIFLFFNGSTAILPSSESYLLVVMPLSWRRPVLVHVLIICVREVEKQCTSIRNHVHRCGVFSLCVTVCFVFVCGFFLIDFWWCCETLCQWMLSSCFVASFFFSFLL
jgi:Ni,Fe-hydrogenase I cytochrome b subunit